MIANPQSNSLDAEHYLYRELVQLFGENTALVDLLSEGCFDGMWYWDLQNTEHEWMSDSFWRLFGHDPRLKRHLAAEWQDLIDQDDLSVALENVERHFADPSYPYDQLVRYTHLNGETIWVRCRGIAIRDADGAPHRMLGLHTDVTEIKRREQELTRANASLERFTSIAAHDLQAPLRKISVFTEILTAELSALDTQPRAAVDAALSAIRDHAMEMRSLVRSLSALSRARTNRLELQPVALNAVVAEALAAAGPEVAAARPIVCIDDLPVVLGEPMLLRQLFANLLSNACKYRGDRPLRIVVDATVDGDGRQAVIGFQDNGVGVPSDRAEDVFLPFERVYSGCAVDGAGVGLTICRDICEAHRGSIALDVAHQDGARFNVLMGLA